MRLTCRVARRSAVVRLRPTSERPDSSVIHWPDVQNVSGSRLVRRGTASSIRDSRPTSSGARGAVGHGQRAAVHVGRRDEKGCQQHLMNPAVGAVLRPDDRPHRLGKLALDVAPEHPVLVVLVVQFGRLLNKIGVHRKGDVRGRGQTSFCGANDGTIVGLSARSLHRLGRGRGGTCRFRRRAVRGSSDRSRPLIPSASWRSVLSAAASGASAPSC